MRKHWNPVIVLGGGLTGLGLARAFRRRGIDILLVLDRKDEAIFSKDCRKSLLLPDFRYNPAILKRFLRKLARKMTRRVVVYPTSDLDALNLSELKDDLVDDFSFVVGDKESVETLVNKSKFYRMLTRDRISYPATYFPKNMEEVRQIGRRVAYPVFLRPSISQLFARVFGGRKKGFIAYSLEDLIYCYNMATKFGIEMMLQDIVPGPPTNSYQLEGYYNTAHRPTVLFARQRLRIWPPDFGNTTLCVSISLEKMASEKEMVNRFLSKIGYSGLMSAEFKEDPRDGTLKFLEINARAWWHFWLSSKCGADIIFASYLDAIGEKPDYVDEYETGVKSTYLILDLMTSAKMLLSRDLGLFDWVSSYRGVSEFAFFRMDDLSPFIMDCLNKSLSVLTA